MKNALKLSLAIATVLMAGNAFAVQTKSIVDSKHNLGDTSVASPTTTRNKTTATTEVCVFCHTPHGGVAKDGDDNAIAPLWNKSLPTTSYQTYNTLGTATLQGSVTSVGSVSIACLSCHDGSQAMDVMINQPGSGGYTAAGARLTGGTWSSPTGNVDTATGKMLTTNPIPGLGADLTNDHPIGIQYAGGLRTGETDRTLSASYKNPDFRGLATTTINGNAIWYVPVPATNATTGVANAINGTQIAPVSGIRNKTDMALYTRTDTNIDGGDAQPFVECASCHDPHQADTKTFLRIDNTGSAVCLACHVK